MVWGYDSAALQKVMGWIKGCPSEFCEAEREAEQATFVTTSTGGVFHHQTMRCCARCFWLWQVPPGKSFQPEIQMFSIFPLSRAMSYSKDNCHVHVQEIILLERKRVNGSITFHQTCIDKSRATVLRCWNPATVGHHICWEVSLWRIMASLARMVSLFRWLDVAFLVDFKMVQVRNSCLSASLCLQTWHCHVFLGKTFCQMSQQCW